MFHSCRAIFNDTRKNKRNPKAKQREWPGNILPAAFMIGGTETRPLQPGPASTPELAEVRVPPVTPTGTSRNHPAEGPIPGNLPQYFLPRKRATQLEKKKKNRTTTKKRSVFLTLVMVTATAAFATI